MSERRTELWSLLGDLPEKRKPEGRILGSERVDGATIEHWVLDLNGVEEVPAWLLLPDKRRELAPGLLYIHSHGGYYNSGKDELFRGAGSALPPYGPDLVARGVMTLAIDSWCFGERQHNADGSTGEREAFCEMLWKGQNLFGMMMFDEYQAFTWLADRNDVDAQRLGALGMSMGATKAWWLAALDERVRLCIDICCLTDFDALLANGDVRRHGIYYYVPSLLKHFSAAEINALITPRPHLSVNGRKDHLTPPEGVERIRDYLTTEYRKFGAESDCRIEMFDCGHEELPEMRALTLEWLERHLVNE